jgi:hypothetical protein
MKNLLIYTLLLSLFLLVLGLILTGIGFWRIKKTAIEHKKVCEDEFLTDDEKPIQNRTIKILVTGLSFMAISTILELIVNFIKLFST